MEELRAKGRWPGQGKSPTIFSAFARSLCAGTCLILWQSSYRARYMANAVSHDQNFKNLILDYPLDALAFFAPEEAPATDDPVRIVPA